MTKAEHLMQKIDALRDELSKKDGLIDQRRKIDPQTSPTTYAEISQRIKKYEDEIDRLIFERLDVLDDPKRNIEDDTRDVDVMEETLHLVRGHLKKAGFDLPFLDDCAAAATKHIKDLRTTISSLSIKEVEGTEERDHRPYRVRRKYCRVCEYNVMSAIMYDGNWSETGEKLSHAKDCPLRNF